MPYLLGIDIGTSGTKTILIDETGHVHARATAEYPLYAPKPQWSEQEPEDWWNAVCSTVQDVLHTSVMRKKIHIVTEIDPDLDDLNLDPGRLKQVLYNYLSNALKFTPEGGAVRLRALAAGDESFRIDVEVLRAVERRSEIFRTNHGSNLARRIHRP